MPSASKLVGQRFGGLYVVRRILEPPALWECLCDCGATCYVLSSRLTSGNTSSCGCRKRAALGERTKTHGLSNGGPRGYVSRAYGIWQAMRDRCTNSHRSDYKYYGGKGIAVCQRWNSFENFFADMGEPPLGLTLDRIDSSKGYEASNCRWATRKTQVDNSSRIVPVSVDGVEKSISDWLRVYNVTKGWYYYQRKKGRSHEEILKALSQQIT